MRFVPLQGKDVFDLTGILGVHHGVVLNYELVQDWLQELKDCRPDCLIIDECQYIKSMSAKRTRAVLQLARCAPSVLGLSGTPLVNRPIELWSVLQAVRPDLFPSRMKFAWRYCQPRRTPWGWMFKGARHLDELAAKLHSECLIRRLKRDVLPELKGRRRSFVVVHLEDMTEYRAAEQQFLRWLATVDPARVRRAARAQALVKVGYLVRLAVRLKLDWTVDWIRRWLQENDGKLVALTMHTFVVDRLQQEFPDLCCVIDGRTPVRKRFSIIHQFQNRDRKRLFIGNWRAAGIGTTLTAASTIVALDLPWTPGDLLQGEDRIYRIGQSEQVRTYYLVTAGTIEYAQASLLRRKSAVLHQILDGYRSGGRTARAITSGGVFDELMSEFSRLTSEGSEAPNRV
jgi:SWI/SNF-related matrix-associated actin-dependent regulator 1 of chromatin subfamily A